MTGPYRDRQVHVLAEKCKTCIFRPGNPMGLTPGRVRGMVRAARAQETAIICHSTIHRDDVERAVCRGYFDAHGDDVISLRLARALDILVEDPVPS